jgi:hypothetical protein
VFVISLKPQDVLIALKLGVNPGKSWSYLDLSGELGLSASETYSGAFRLGVAMLLDIDERRPRIANLLEFLEHGIRYAFVSERGRVTRGVPTAHSAQPLLAEFLSSQGDIRSRDDSIDLPLVWPHPEGSMRGESLEPLYPSAVGAALRDSALYECLALVDALRIGRARERGLAVQLLRKRLRRR